jgi:tetratricopeptide (TPR) repeat protein
VWPSAAVMNDLILAFRTGSRTLRQMPDRDLFNERLSELIAEHFDDADRDGLRLVGSEGSQGLRAARARSAEAARQHFETGEKLLDTLPMSEGARKIARSAFLAQQAYYIYTTGRYPQSIALLSEAFSINLWLESECGIDVLIGHRIQLLNNFMRIEARRGRWQEAFALGGTLLRYLEDARDGSIRSLGSPWNEGWLDRIDFIPSDLLTNTHAQIAAEEILVLERAERQQASDREIASALRAMLATGANSQVDSWMRFRLARLSPDKEDYFAAAISAVKRGSVPSAPLWYSVARDVTNLLRPGVCALANCWAT